MASFWTGMSSFKCPSERLLTLFLTASLSRSNFLLIKRYRFFGEGISRNNFVFGGEPIRDFDNLIKIRNQSYVILELECLL